MTDALMHSAVAAQPEKCTLKELVNNFMSMALMIRGGRKVKDVKSFKASVGNFFHTLELDARAADYSVEQVKDTQYALCAFLDESILNAGESEIRSHMEMNPFQFQYFGVHLAGEGLFDKLDILRGDVRSNLDVLEVYHLCLALGFEGKYGLAQKDQLRYIANTLGQDIARYRDISKVLSPDWALPDQVSRIFRYEIPTGLYLAMIALVCTGVYLTLNGLLGKQVAVLAEQVSRLFSV